MLLRGGWAALNIFLATIVVATPTMLAGLFRVRWPRFYDWGARGWARWILRGSGTPVQLVGMENVQRDSPLIFVSNHHSWYDVFALAAVVPRRFRFVAKKELERLPLFGRAWKAAGHISVDRSNRVSAIQSLDEAGRLIREDGGSVILFAEGTRSRDGKLLPFKKGAFMLALHTGIDIVPTAVCWTREILPKGGWRIRPGPIMVRFGEPVRTADFAVAERDALMKEVRQRIEDLLAEAPPAPQLVAQLPQADAP